MLNTNGSKLEAALAACSVGGDRWAAAQAFIAADIPILTLKPGTKDPLDARTDREKAHDANADGGVTRSGIYAATVKKARLEKYFTRIRAEYGQDPNLGIVPHLAGLVVIDTDTAEQDAALRELATADTDEDPELYVPTVQSPGARNNAGEWIHSGGGHYYYLVDVEDLAEVGGEFTLPGGAVVTISGRYYVLPPSVREEGPYRVTGPVRALSRSPWLLTHIMAHAIAEENKRKARQEAARERLLRREAGLDELGQSVSAWSDSHSWDEILTTYEWRRAAGKRDSKCACPVYTAPGDHDSPKSATAHEDGCTSDRVELENGSGPLQIWTSSRPPELMGQDRWTKAQFVAAMNGQTMGEFLQAWGLVKPDVAADALALDVPIPPKPAAAAEPVATRNGSDHGDLFGTVPTEGTEGNGGNGPGTEGPETTSHQGERSGTEGNGHEQAQTAPGGPDDGNTGQERSTWAPADLAAILSGDYVPPTPDLLPVYNGAGEEVYRLIYPGLVHSFHGESESGKSLVLQAVSVELLHEGLDVPYIDYESDAGAIVDRLTQLGATAQEIVGHFTYIRPEESLSSAMAFGDWAELLSREFALVVIDGVTDSFSTFGLDSNSNDDVTKWMRAFPRRLADHTGAGVAVIDHVTKAKDNRGRMAIGGQAKMAGLTGAAYIVDVRSPLGRGRRGELVLRIGKDRPGFIRGRLPVPEEQRTDRTEPVAIVSVDSSAGLDHTEVRFTAPDPMVGAGAAPANSKRRALARYMENLSIALEETGEVGMSRTRLRTHVNGKASAVQSALLELIREGYVAGRGGEDPNERGVSLVSVRKYRTAEDPFLEPEAEPGTPLEPLYYEDADGGGDDAGEGSPEADPEPGDEAGE